MSTSAAVASFARPPPPPLPPDRLQRRQLRRLARAATVIVGIVVALVVALVDDLHIGTDIGLRARSKTNAVWALPGSTAAGIVPAGVNMLYDVEGVSLWQRQFVGDDRAIVYASNDALIVTRRHVGPVDVVIGPPGSDDAKTTYTIPVDGAFTIAHAATGRSVLLPVLLFFIAMSVVVGGIVGLVVAPTKDPLLAERRRRRALLWPAVAVPVAAMLVVQQLVVFWAVGVVDALGSFPSDPHDNTSGWMSAGLFLAMLVPMVFLVRLAVLRALALVERRPVDARWRGFMTAAVVTTVVLLFVPGVLSLFVGVVVVAILRAGNDSVDDGVVASSSMSAAMLQPTDA